MMVNPIKQALRRWHVRLLNDINEAMGKLESRLDTEVENAKNALHHTQLQINHNQMALYEEIGKRLKNSGILHLSDTEIIVKIFSGLKMYLDPRDVAVVPHLALDTIWEHRITAAWLAVVRSHDVILDIGANFGYFGALAAQRTDKKHSKVIFFEANPHLIPYMRKTLAVNWLNEQSVLENLAIADKKGKITLNLLKDYVGSSSVLPLEHTKAYMHDKMYLELQESIPVQAVAVDDYCKQHEIRKVDLIKIDIEGFEDKAYLGMRETVKASPELTLFIEFTKDSYEDPEGFYNQMLKDFGHVYVIDDEGYIVRPKKTDYASVIGQPDDWVMPIFSKRDNLANR